MARANIVVSGGTGSGKTTLLNVLSGYIPADERIVTIEDAAELQLRQRHVARLETRPAGPDGAEINIRKLVMSSLRMRPDRLVVGEVRGAEALDMLQAMNTGHDGSLTTLHANKPRDALARIETLVLMAGYDLPVRAIRAQVASAINVIVHLERLRDGTRKVVQISELTGMEEDVITMQDIFRFVRTGIDAQGRVTGRFAPSGIRPRILERLDELGQTMPVEIQQLFPEPPLRSMQQ
jgi:pilus assembly protein CpaF